MGMFGRIVLWWWEGEKSAKARFEIRAGRKHCLLKEEAPTLWREIDNEPGGTGIAKGRTISGMWSGHADP